MFQYCQRDCVQSKNWGLRINAQLAQKFCFSFRPRQRRWRLLGTQYPHGVRVEGKDHHGRRGFLGESMEAFDNAGVSSVHTVKVADRYGTAA